MIADNGQLWLKHVATLLNKKHNCVGCTIWRFVIENQITTGKSVPHVKGHAWFLLINLDYNGKQSPSSYL